MLSEKELLSRTITFLRLPLIIGVVFIHTNLTSVMLAGECWVTEGQFPIHDIIRHLLTGEFACIAVPLFFFMSGFLFFTHTEFTFSAYKKKLGRRLHTLLIPYLFWNLLVLLLFFLAQSLLSTMTSGTGKLIVDYTFTDWLRVFWNQIDGMPMCYQFWFIRDLMVVALFSPLVYWFIRYFKVYGVVLLGALWSLGIWNDIAGFSGVAFFFFTFGSWFAVNQHNFVTDFKPLRTSFTLLYLLIVIINTILWYKQSEMFEFMHSLGIIVGLIAVVGWTAYGIQKGKLKCNALLAGCSFFIYAYHAMPLAFLMKLCSKVLHPVTELTMILAYLFIPFIIVGTGIGIYVLMQKCLPRFTSFITGGR